MKIANISRQTKIQMKKCTQIVFYTSKMCNVKMYWEIT